MLSSGPPLRHRGGSSRFLRGLSFSLAVHITMRSTVSVLRAAAVAVALAAGASTAAAQEQPTLQPGTRVRVSVPLRHANLDVRGTGAWVVGTVRETTPTSVVIQTNPADSLSRTEYPFDVIRRIEVSQGRADAGASIARGAARGAVMGAGLAMLYVGGAKLFHGQCESPACERESGVFTDDGATLARNAGILVGASTLLAAAFGSVSRERWVPTRAPRVSAGRAPNGGATLALDISF